MIQLGTVGITQRHSIIEVRNKVRFVAEALTDDSVLATRLATATSEMVRVLVAQSIRPRLEVSIKNSEQSFALVLSFYDEQRLPRPSFLERFFDRVDERNMGDEFLIRAVSVLGRPRALSDERINEIREFVQQKSRDALMTEVQAKNLELESHRERLEQTVKKRTAQLEDAMQGARAANEAKSQFLANMSHELRTPMNAIIGYTEMLVEDAEDLGQDDFIPDLKKIHTAGKHLLALINDILDLSKIEAGKMELYCEDFEVSSLLKEIASTIHSLVEKNANQLELEYGDELGIMHSDLTKVRQCLFNLLSNACKFTEKGTITLSADRIEADADSMIRFRVADTGIGVPPENLEKLFQEFTQADASTTRKYGGTGLGLTITRKFCEMMGGTIRVTSKIGEGTTFVIDLPLKCKSETKTGEEDLPSSGQPSASKDLGENHVLVIDDDEAARDLLRRTLEGKGYSVQLASEGREGIELARQVRPSLITLDVMMPGMDGWAVLQELRADSELQDVPVVMISLAENRQLGYSLGAVEYLSKPVDRQALLKLVGQYVDLSESPLALVVDDDAAARSTITRALHDAGWEVVEAVNGAKALKELDLARPDVILLDLIMPVMDGFEFLVELQKNSEHRSIPVIVVTAKDLTQEERARLKGAAALVLEKAALDLDELMEQIQSASSRLAKAGQDRSGAEE